ncbi:DNA polymerase alpha catalytic subunit [Lactifluus subvellereus]|nr:DNA polymerase alpha catalytic subunit [Lactifluus subvellereus]
MADRSRRDLAKADKYAPLKLARQGGRRDWKGEDAEIYDEVTEDQYKSVVQGRLAKDDFVVDDGVGDYVDNGMDDWGNDDAQEDSEDEIAYRKAKPSKAKPKAQAKNKPAPPATTSLSAYRPAVSGEQEDAFMSGLLGDWDVTRALASSKANSRPRKRKPSPDYRHDDRSSSPGPSDGRGTTYARSGRYGHRELYLDTSSDGLPSDGFDVGNDISSDDGLITSPKKKVRTEAKGIAPAIEKMGAMDVAGLSGSQEDDYYNSFDDIPFQDLMDTDEKPSLPIKAEPVNAELPKVGANSATTKKEENLSWLSVYDSLSVKSDETFGKLGNAVASSSTHASTISALEDDGSFRFFWLDYLEHEGVLYFIGKTLDKNTNAYVSCCVTVAKLQRNLFVLPRPFQLDEEGFETDVVPDMQAVWRDFDQVRKKAGIKGWKAKFVKRKYAFGEPDVPREETQWLKVVYGFEEPQIPANVASPTFSRIFGTNTSAFELLVLKRKIMGPCWLQIKKPHVEYKGVSWCKLEVTVTDLKDINPFAETDPNAPRDTPPLTIASLSIRTIVNHQENIREIVCATARIWSNTQIDDPTPPEALPCSVHTLVRPLGRFPPGFEAQVKSNAKGLISPMNNERMLLNSLLVTLHKADPDILVGHDFLGVSLDILLHRMRDLKADHWSRIGRFRRSKWPGIGRQGTNLRFLNGRLLCDLASDGAKSMISSTTWSLTEMCATHLKSVRQDIDAEDTASYFDDSVSTPDRLITFVRHCELDAHYQMAIAAKVQILPLTRQLTNLAGNSWNKTLNGGRAERNEYILLHEFHRLKYICPDKQWGKKAVPVKVEQEDDGEGGETKTSKGKRDKYKGGLVFEPKRGLWDKFILVMDFNSLYPSIIQEYNIDFTTVDRQGSDDDKIPEPPALGVSQGVLPRLIATLVSRRRQVKALMKDRSVSPAKLLQYDIKQQALKLTANSMYGCLGFEYSRFYAKPLAALTTFKESLQLDVIYGDTDSVFVNSNVTELSEALKISAELKKAVNDRYKLLEIDLDGIFQRLLLLQKKKYAAIKIKGLDMKRREYCALSKTVSQYVLDQILSGEATEIVDVRAGKIKLDEFIIHKRLGKSPEDYPDAKSQPHVQVALRMKARNTAVRAGDVVPYIFCISEGDGTGNTAQAERARHPDELRKSGSEIQIDYEYYLVHQVLPPIERLCDPMEGTDRARLAECLGLDPGRYRSTTTNETEEGRFSTLESQLPESERYKDAVPFVVRCRACECCVAFAPVANRAESLVKAKGSTCPMCDKTLGTASLQIQLECQIRERIHKYYEGWTICDDPTCGNRARMMGVYGRRCLKDWCRGEVSFEYSDAMLYNQLRYFLYLFDIEKARATNPDEMLALAANHGDFLQRMRQTVEKYLEHNGRRWVDMGSLFSFMKL